MTGRSDLELVEDFRNGDEKAFNEIVLRYQEKIYWVVRRYLPGHDDADDVVQDIFVRVYERMSEFRSESGFYTWLYRIAVNTSLNAIRRQKIREFFRVEEVEEQEDPDALRPDQILEFDEQKQLLEEAIKTLPKKQRMVFLMRFVDHMSYEDISAILKTSVGGLKANYFHASRKIEEYLRNAHES